MATEVTASFGNERVGVALVGLGRMGFTHLRNIMSEPRANLKYCFDVDTNRLAFCEKSMFFGQFGIKALHMDQYEVALKDPEVQVVMIATPTNLHEEQTRRALSAGKSVMCEKPLTPRTGSILPLYELAKANKVFLLAAFNKHYDPEHRHMRSQMQSGSLGTVHLIRIVSRDYTVPPLSYIRISSGLFHDTCVHDFDLCLFFMRKLPKSAQVMGKTWKEVFLNDPDQLATLSPADREQLPEVDDYFMAVVTVQFDDGSVVTIDNSRQANHGYDQRCEIVGTKAMIRRDFACSTNVVRADVDGFHHATLPDTPIRYREAYINELRDILTMGALASERKYDDKALVRKSLMEPVRPSTTFAAHSIADACAKAAKTASTVEFHWTEEFRRQFESEHQS